MARYRERVDRLEAARTNMTEYSRVTRIASQSVDLEIEVTLRGEAWSQFIQTFECSILIRSNGRKGRYLIHQT